MGDRILLSVLVSVFVSVSVARADTTLSADTTGGNGSFTEVLTLGGSSTGDAKTGDSTETDWSIVGTLSRTSPDATNPASFNNDFAGNLSFLLGNSWDIGGALDKGGGGVAQAGGYSSFGANVFLGYKFSFGGSKEAPSPAPAVSKQETPSNTDNSESDAEDEDAFVPSLEFKGIFYFSSYGAQTRTPRPQSVSLPQYGAGGEVDFSPWEWAALRGAYTRYRYGMDVATFIGYLDSKRGLIFNFGLGGLGNVATGFPADMGTLELTFYPIGSWELDLEGDGTLSAYDGSYSRAFKATASVDVASWLKIGVGYEKDTSPTVAAQDMGILNLDFTL